MKDKAVEKALAYIFDNMIKQADANLNQSKQQLLQSKKVYEEDKLKVIELESMVKGL